MQNSKTQEPTTNQEEEEIVEVKLHKKASAKQRKELARLIMPQGKGTAWYPGTFNREKHSYDETIDPTFEGTLWVESPLSGY